MFRTLFWPMATLLACSSVSLAQDQPAAKGLTSFRVEVRGVLRVTGKLRQMKELEAPNSRARSIDIDQVSIHTGAAIITEQMDPMDVYFGGDEHLQNTARTLNGKSVVLSGDLAQVTYFSKKDVVRGELLAFSEKIPIYRPAQITRSYIRVARLEAAGPAKKKEAEPAKEPIGYEGILWCWDEMYPGPELDAKVPVAIGRPRSPLTGFTLASVLASRNVFTSDVYLPSERLKKRAKELSGQRVTVSGELKRLIVMNEWYGDEKSGADVPSPLPAGKGRSIWMPSSLIDELPHIRHVLWATDVQPLAPATAPLTGQPSYKEGFETFYTYLRLPKSMDVVSFKLQASTNASLPGLKPITLANFPAILDSMKAIKGEREETPYHRAGWYDCQFETAEGAFKLWLYLGGRGILISPNGRRGWVDFDWKVVDPPMK